MIGESKRERKARERREAQAAAAFRKITRRTIEKVDATGPMALAFKRAAS